MNPQHLPQWQPQLKSLERGGQNSSRAPRHCSTVLVGAAQRVGRGRGLGWQAESWGPALVWDRAGPAGPPGSGGRATSDSQPAWAGARGSERAGRGLGQTGNACQRGGPCCLVEGPPQSSPKPGTVFAGNGLRGPESPSPSHGPSAAARGGQEGWRRPRQEAWLSLPPVLSAGRDLLPLPLQATRGTRPPRLHEEQGQ